MEEGRVRSAIELFFDPRRAGFGDPVILAVVIAVLNRVEVLVHSKGIYSSVAVLRADLVRRDDDVRGPRPGLSARCPDVSIAFSLGDVHRIETFVGGRPISKLINYEAPSPLESGTESLDGIRRSVGVSIRSIRC